MGHRWRRLGVLVAVAVGAGACGGGGSDGVEGVRFVEPVFDEVEVTAGVTYREAPDFEDGPIPLELDLYEPAGDTEDRRPVALVIFPGGFSSGDRTDVAPMARDLARRGFVAVAIDYRLRDDGMNDGFPDAVLDAYDDAVAAVDWLSERASEYRLDPEVVVAVGFSSGAVVAWNLAWLPSSPGSPRPDPVGVSAAVSVAGTPAFLSEPTAGAAPLLAFNGELDTTVRLEWARDPCTAAATVGARCDLVVYEGAEHSIGSTHLDRIEPCAAQFIADAVLVDAGYVPSDAAGPACSGSA